MMRAPFHPAPTSGLDVIIQPEMSFGTGHHPTTWQMMRCLLDLDLEGQVGIGYWMWYWGIGHCRT